MSFKLHKACGPVHVYGVRRATSLYHAPSTTRIHCLSHNTVIELYGQLQGQQ